MPAPAPRIIDYPIVLEAMGKVGLRSLYYNSGAFGFADAARARVIGWIGPTDTTLRPEAAAVARQAGEPYEANLAGLLTSVWTEFLRGNAWVMPMSHWAYELDFGSREWMPAALQQIGVDSALLQPRTNASAIEFALEESEQFRFFTQQLLEKLVSSDFAVAFPGRAVVCTLHHHKQIWWTTTDDTIYAALNAAVPP